MAEFLVWTPSITVHVDEIDSQHKELISRANSLMKAVVSGQGKNNLVEFVTFLADYTDFHFRSEETMMRKFQYPAYNVHKNAHDYLREEVRNFLDSLAEGPAKSETVISVVEGLGDWVMNHIRKMDVEMGKFLRTKL